MRFPVPGEEGQLEGASGPLSPWCRPGAGPGLKMLTHWHEPRTGRGHSELWPGNGGVGITGPTFPSLEAQVQLPGREEVAGAGTDMAASGKVTGKLVASYTNYISNQPERGAGINLSGGQLRESSGS